MKDIEARKRFNWLLEEGHKELCKARASMNKTGDITSSWFYTVRTLVFFYYGHMRDLSDVNNQMLQISGDYFDMLDVVIPYLHKDEISVSERNKISDLIDRLIVGLSSIKQRMVETEYERIS